MELFKARPPISQEEYDWLLACFAWLRQTLKDADKRPELVTFEHPKLSGANSAGAMFDAIRELSGMAEWPCRLEKVEVRDADRELGLIEGKSACGTFSIEDGEAVIRYSSAMLTNPEAMAATFAHELCHYLLAAAGDPPGGPDLMEHATDCAATYLGFGVLLANSSRQFSTWSDGATSGWQSQLSGYLSEQSLLTGTAMFAALHGYDAMSVVPSLKPNLRKDMKKAVKAISRDHEDLRETLGKIDLGDWR